MDYFKDNREFCVKGHIQRMRRVKQGDSTGCGFACIAMLANTTYEYVRNLAVEKLGFNESGAFYTGTRELRELAACFNIEIGKRRRKFKCFKELPETAILGINYKEESDVWHWVVYRRTPSDEFVYDPNENIKSNKRRDFWRINPKWFLPIVNI